MPESVIINTQRLTDSELSHLFNVATRCAQSGDFSRTVRAFHAELARELTRTQAIRTMAWPETASATGIPASATWAEAVEKLDEIPSEG